MDKTHQKKFPSKLSMLAERLSSIYSSSHTMDGASSYCSSHVNIVTEAVSVLPSLTSTFSLEQPRGIWLAGREPSNLSDAGQVSVSMQEGLQYDDYEDEFDNPDYTDTVKSNDSFLKRSLSVPARPNPYEEHRHMKDIFGGGDDDEKLQDESEEDKKWRQTMDDLLENPEYVNSLESQSSQKVLLAKAAVKFASDIKAHDGVRHNYMRALIVLSVGFMQVFLAYMALRNLQSSLNSRGGLGLYVLTCAYAFLLIGCIFAPTIVQLLRPKRTILICMVGILVFILTNFYPVEYLLLPAACMVGFSLACLWTAHSTYMTNIAMSYATQQGKSIQQVLTKFNGIFFMMFQAAQIIGGALSSVILTMSDSSSATALNDSLSMVNLTEVSYKHCGASYSHSMAAADTIDISKSTVYVMLGIFATFATIGIIVILFCLDGLEGTMKKSALSIGGRLLATFTFLIDVRVVLLMGLMCYSFLQMSFMLGEFTKVTRTSNSLIGRVRIKTCSPRTFYEFHIGIGHVSCTIKITSVKMFIKLAAYYSKQISKLHN